MPDAYERKVSGEEAREGYLMVLKDRLGFFPPQGKSFPLIIAGARYEAVVDSYHCQCRGPEKPHDHYFIRIPGLAKDERVTLGRTKTGYELSRS